MQDVFISYSSKEFGAAEAVRVTLEENGISCWMAPGSIPGGSNYTKEIPVAIRRCRVFVLILSEKSQASHWVLKELDAAVGHGKVVLPFMLENFTLSDEFSFLLSGTQWYSAYLDADKELENMVARIQSIIASGAPQKHPMKKPRPAPKPEPRPEPKPEPKSEPTVAPELCCPACGSSLMVPLKNARHSYDGAEFLRFWIVPLIAIPAALAAFLLAAFITWVIGGNLTAQLIIPIGAALLALLLAIRGGIKLAQENIRRKRVRTHTRAWGVQCQSCAKKYRVAVPFGTAFPWENPEQ